MKTLYVTDLDGTLLNTEEKLSQYTIGTINEFIKKGGQFTFATARSLSSASIVTKGLKVELPVIVYNGGFIMNAKSGKVISSSIYSYDEKEYIIKLMEKYKVSPLVYSYVNGIERVSWILGSENEGMRHYLSKRKGDKRMNPLGKSDDLYQGDVFYFTCIGEQEKLYPIYETLKENPCYNCIYQQELYREEYWCEIMPKKATKANGIQSLKEIFHFDRIVCFGDAVNDIPMFQISDECYAVENAVPQLKEIATGVIGSNNVDGVARWIESNGL